MGSGLALMIGPGVESWGGADSAQEDRASSARMMHVRLLIAALTLFGPPWVL